MIMKHKQGAISDLRLIFNNIDSHLSIDNADSPNIKVKMKLLIS